MKIYMPSLERKVVNKPDFMLTVKLAIIVNVQRGAIEDEKDNGMFVVLELLPF